MNPYGSTPYGARSFALAPEDPDSINDTCVVDDHAEAMYLNVLQSQATGLDELIAALGPKVTASDSAQIAGEPVGDVLDNLIDRITVSATADAKGRFGSGITENANFTDAIAAAWQMLVADEASLEDTAESTVRKLALIADSLSALGSVDTKLTALIAVSVAAALEGRVAAGYAAEVVDQAALTDEVRGILSALLEAADTAQATDDAAGSLSLVLLAGDAASAADTPAAALSALADAADSAVIFATLRLNGFDYQGWAINMDLRAVTEYRNVPFDSFAILNGRTYAANADGIFELSGDDDDGTPIDAWLTPFLTDFGTQKFKRVTDIWLGGTGQDLYVKVHSRDPRTGIKAEDLYTVVRKQADGEAPGRVEVGRGIKSTHFGVTLCNVDGADFALDSIAWRPLILDRRQ